MSTWAGPASSRPRHRWLRQLLPAEVEAGAGGRIVLNLAFEALRILGGPEDIPLTDGDVRHSESAQLTNIITARHENDERHTTSYQRPYFRLFQATPTDRNESQWSSKPNGEDLQWRAFLSVGVARNRRKKRSLVAGGVAFDILRF